MSTDPELADAPDTPQDIAWEVRHCADRLDSLAELVFEVDSLSSACLTLRSAADEARRGAAKLDGSQR